MKNKMIWFLEPRDDRGVSFLKVEHENGEDENANVVTGI